MGTCIACGEERHRGPCSDPIPLDEDDLSRPINQDDMGEDEDSDDEVMSSARDDEVDPHWDGGSSWVQNDDGSWEDLDDIPY